MKTNWLLSLVGIPVLFLTSLVLYQIYVIENRYSRAKLRPKVRKGLTTSLKTSTEPNKYTSIKRSASEIRENPKQFNSKENAINNEMNINSFNGFNSFNGTVKNLLYVLVMSSRSNKVHRDVIEEMDFGKLILKIYHFESMFCNRWMEL